MIFSVEKTLYLDTEHIPSQIRTVSDLRKISRMAGYHFFDGTNVVVKDLNCFEFASDAYGRDQRPDSPPKGRLCCFVEYSKDDEYGTYRVCLLNAVPFDKNFGRTIVLQSGPDSAWIDETVEALRKTLERASSGGFSSAAVWSGIQETVPLGWIHLFPRKASQDHGEGDV